MEICSYISGSMIWWLPRWHGIWPSEDKKAHLWPHSYNLPAAKQIMKRVPITLLTMYDLFLVAIVYESEVCLSMQKSGWSAQPFTHLFNSTVVSIRYHILEGAYTVADLQNLSTSEGLATSLHGNFLSLSKRSGVSLLILYTPIIFKLSPGSMESYCSWRNG